MYQEHAEGMTPADTAALRMAQGLLEAPSLLVQMSEMLGTPVEHMVNKLPQTLQVQIHQSVIKALQKSSNAAVWSLAKQTGKPAALLQHKLAAAASGFAGGFFGLPGLLLEIPVTTTIMLRSIADIARSEGVDLQLPGAHLACLEVLALVGTTASAGATTSAYYASRLALSELAELSAQELLAMSKQAGLHAITAKQASKWLSKFIEAIANRFGVVITEKTAAQLVPVIGAASAATLNTLFTQHYQKMARGHFIIKRLELRYGEQVVRQAYQRQQGLRNISPKP